MPRRFRGLYDPAMIALPPNFAGGHPFDNGDLHGRDEQLAAFPRDPDEVRRHIAEYYGMISHLDERIGDILDALDERGQRDNTIVVVAGDNGLALGQHGLMGKQNLYDHSIRVPLILAGPGIPAGVRSAAWVYLLDIFPTLCDLCGMARPASVEGRSFAPVLRGEAGSHRDCLYLIHTRVQRGVRLGRHKLIEYVVGGRRTGTQLFDLVDDPYEQHNLADSAEHAATLAALRQELLRLSRESGDRDTPRGEAFWSGYDA
jgi:arylsulfatase A-like enzyme